MDKYLKKPERSKDHSANVSAADRAKQHKKSEVFEDGGRLFQVGYFVDPVLGYVQYKTKKGAHNWQKVRA